MSPINTPDEPTDGKREKEGADNQKPNNTNDDKKRVAVFCIWIKRNKDILMLLTQFGLVIVGIASAWIIYIMTDQQINSNKTITATQTRAYLGLEITGWHGLYDNTELGYHYIIRNYGATPATDVSVRGQIEINKFPLPVGFIPKYEGGVNQKGIVYPNQNGFSLGANIKAKKIFTQEEIKEITDSHSLIRAYSFVKIVYVDVFGIKRHNFFCSYLDPESIVRDSTGKIKTWTWATYNGYNYID